jgi:hypothetical protein
MNHNSRPRLRKKKQMATACVFLLRCACALPLLFLPLSAGCRAKSSTPETIGNSRVPAERMPYISGEKTTVFHRQSCTLWREIPARQRLGWADAQSALRAGKIPCVFCRPTTADADETAGARKTNGFALE